MLQKLELAPYWQSTEAISGISIQLGMQMEMIFNLCQTSYDDARSPIHKFFDHSAVQIKQLLRYGSLSSPPAKTP